MMRTAWGNTRTRVPSLLKVPTPCRILAQAGGAVGPRPARLNWSDSRSFTHRHFIQHPMERLAGGKIGQCAGVAKSRAKPTSPYLAPWASLVSLGESDHEVS